MAEKQKNVKEKQTATDISFSRAQYRKWYKDMLIMRRLEEKAGQLLIQGKFGGFCHLYIGQEAVAAGAASAIESGDKLITAYRDHAYPVALGMHPKYVIAELFGKQTGCVKGKGGSMHMFDKERNLFGGHGIVGGHIPLGAGMALAEKYSGTGNGVLCFFGDGAVHQGSFHETMNMAMTWKLPLVFVIENNRYAMGTSIDRASNVTELYKLGFAYEMPCFPVDGMSVEAIHEAIHGALEQAREGNGPTLIEANTYRYKGHSVSDPAKYRTKEEVEQYKARDPIEQVAKTIKQKRYMTKKQMEETEKEVKGLITEAVEFADESPAPEPEELYEDVYAQADYPFIREY